MTRKKKQAFAPGIHRTAEFEKAMKELRSQVGNDAIIALSNMGREHHAEFEDVLETLSDIMSGTIALYIPHGAYQRAWEVLCQQAANKMIHNQQWTEEGSLILSRGKMQ